MKLNVLSLSMFALPAVLAIACGGSGSSSGGDSTSPALRGTYVPVGNVSNAEFEKITFLDATNYSYLRANCTSSCSSNGTYTFNGNDDLELTDGSTLKTEHVDFKAEKYSDQGTSLTQSVHVLGGLVMGSGGSLVNGDAGSLISGDGGSLLSQILQALMNGIQMALQNANSGGDGGSGGDDNSSGDDGGTASACANPALLAACVAAGGNFSSNADGSCTCVQPDAGKTDAAVDAGADSGDDSGN